MIELKNITKLFHEGQSNEAKALDKISFTVEKGSVVVLDGVSGSGKSTLLSIMSGMSKPTSGSVEIEGKNIAKLPDFHLSKFRNQSIGFIFQSFELFEDLSVYENVALLLIPMGLSLEALDTKVLQALQHANIEHKADALVRHLSGGEKQRTAIARALVNEASLLICDEPTASLDAKNAEEFLSILATLKSKQRTIIIATHDPLVKSQDFVDRIITIEDGKVHA